MITKDHSCAIGQVCSLDGTSLGTGFLIAVEADGTGKVLTAGHVVSGQPDLEVRFDAAGQRMPASVSARGLRDWALLCGPAPANVRPLSLHQPPRTTSDVTWFTIGYPTLATNTRRSFHGKVRVADREEFDLHCVELPLGTLAKDAEGLSGAPCVVDGGVIGVITDVLENRRFGSVLAGTVLALPSWIIAAESGLALADAAVLPWEKIFIGAVRRWPVEWQEIAAEKVGLDTSVICSPRVIARRMINEGIVTTAHVLCSLKTPATDSEPLVELAETLWVDSETALHMDGAIDGNRPAVLATEVDWSAQHHLSRAFAFRNPGHPDWQYVHIGEIHGTLEVIIADVERALAKRFEVAGTAAVAREVTARHPVTAFLHGSPRDDLTRCLKMRWAALRVIYLTAAKPSNSGAPVVEMIRPVPDPARETGAAVANHRARNMLGLPTKVGTR